MEAEGRSPQIPRLRVSATVFNALLGSAEVVESDLGKSFRRSRITLI